MLDLLGHLSWKYCFREKAILNTYFKRVLDLNYKQTGDIVAKKAKMHKRS